MPEIIKKDENGLLNLMHNTQQGLGFNLPFERDILLFETYVAGTSHVEGIEDLVPTFTPGTRLDFFREPENLYDAMAVLVKNKDGKKIGYIPQRDNLVFARLMDAGKQLFGRVTEVELVDDYWYKISMDIFLHE